MKVGNEFCGKEYFSENYRLYVREWEDGVETVRRANDDEFTEYAVFHGLIQGVGKLDRWRKQK